MLPFAIENDGHRLAVAEYNRYSVADRYSAIMNKIVDRENSATRYLSAER